MTTAELRELITYRMLDAGLSASQLARMSDVSCRSVHEWMAGQSLTQAAVFLTALEVLGVHLRVCGNPHRGEPVRLQNQIGSQRADS